MNFDRDYSELKKYSDKTYIVGLPEKKIQNYLSHDDQKNNVFNFLVLQEVRDH